jgi:hypothetical protein
MHRVTTSMFKPSDLFDLADWQYRDILDRLDYAWAALPLIHDYVLGLIKHTGARKPDLPGVRYLGEELFIHPNATVEPDVYIKAPAYIDSSVEIRSGAYITAPRSRTPSSCPMPMPPISIMSVIASWAGIPTSAPAPSFPTGRSLPIRLFTSRWKGRT